MGVRGRSIRRVIIATALACSGVTALGGHALAAKPAVQACLGTTISAEASEAHGDFGALVASEAHEFGGVGSLVQAFQSGEVPDEVEPNDCN